MVQTEQPVDGAKAQAKRTRCTSCKQPYGALILWAGQPTCINCISMDYSDELAAPISLAPQRTKAASDVERLALWLGEQDEPQTPVESLPGARLPAEPLAETG